MKTSPHNLALQKAWREKNKEYCREQSKKYYLKNREDRLKKAKIWYEANRERQLLVLKKWRDNPVNKEKQRLAVNKWHKFNIESKRLWRDKSLQRRRDFINNIKADKSCTDCDIVYPFVCMDYDHVRGKKKYSISAMAAQRKPESEILIEIAKCELVCANCHRIRTYSRIIEKNPNTL